MFCAPSRRFESRMTFDTDSSAVNGGQMTMSTSLILASSSLRLPTNASASAAVLFIFQLPAMINLRSLFMSKKSCSSSFSNLRSVRTAAAATLVVQRRDAGQDRAFQKLQTRTATSAHERHLVAQFGLVERLHAVAAADDALCAVLLRHVGHRLGDGIGAGGKLF